MLRMVLWNGLIRMLQGFDMGGSKISGLGAPTEDNDAARKAYVDGIGSITGEVMDAKVAAGVLLAAADATTKAGTAKTEAKADAAIDAASKVAAGVGLVEVIDLVIDGYGSVLTGGSAAKRVLYGGVIKSITMLSDVASADAKVDIKKATYANFPTTTSIVGTGTAPELTNAQKVEVTDLTGYTAGKTVAAGEVLEAVLAEADPAPDLVKKLTIQIKIERA